MKNVKALLIEKSVLKKIHRRKKCDVVLKKYIAWSEFILELLIYEKFSLDNCYTN